MNNQIKHKKKRWFDRLQNTRRYYSFQRWNDKPAGTRVLIKELWKWISYDVSYLIRWNINLLLQLKNFGVEVKKYSGLSFFQQWKRMAYLVFKVRVDSNAMRAHHLFQDERWEKVDTYSFNRHTLVQNEFMGYPYQDEITCFRDKLKYDKFCCEHNIKVSKVYSVFDEGELTFTDSGEGPLPAKNLFIKELRGSSGRGAKKFFYTDGLYNERAGNVFNRDELQKHFKKEWWCDCSGSAGKSY